MASIGSTQILCLNLDLKLPSIGCVAQINKFCEPVSTVNHQCSIFFKRPNSLILCGKLSYISFPIFEVLYMCRKKCFINNVLSVVSCYNSSNVIYLYRLLVL